MGHNYQPGDKVIAILDADPNLKRVRVLGSGTYEGEQSPPDDIIGTREQMEISLRSHLGKPNYSEEQIARINSGEDPESVGEPESEPFFLTDEQVEEWIDKARINPKILLENGKVVWGRECWWGSEDDVLHRFPKDEWTWVDLDIEEVREQMRNGCGDCECGEGGCQNTDA